MSDKRSLEEDRIWIVESNHETTLLDRIALHAINRAIVAESQVELSKLTLPNLDIKIEQIRSRNERLKQDSDIDYLIVIVESLKDCLDDDREVMGLQKSQIESLKAITELAVKGLREIRDHKVHSYASSYQLIGMAQTTLEQIREVSHE